MSKLPPPERLARDLDWNLLRTFLVLAQSRSVTDAAERLSLKQPTVSSALKRLEDRLGKRLIDRRPGRFELTSAGRLLLTEATDIHGAILRLGTAMRDVGDEVTGHVSVAMASHVISPLFDAALTDFHAAYPRATLSIEISASREALDAVTARRVSFAVCLVNEHKPGLEYRRLFREYFGLFCGPAHPLFGRHGLSMADLAGHSSVSFVTDQANDALRAVTMMRSEARLDDRIVGTSANLEEVRRMITAGLGIGPLPLHVVKEDVAMGRLWRLPPYESPPAIDVHVAWNPRTRSNRAEQALLAKLLERIENTPMEQRIYV
ncbi:MAG: LysR family transcriptional regulator [Alphaproteobacteria bacterium]|jgi:DNA-binding transcriptional LysR family regulator|nr:LysR family transcriptional regulator [Alphaproteobacteria bacterium]MBU0803551.1 LysR family transcriptional regulator [Alphaproteobacteria bacterium]MBU0873152.1 LysR family transcriptional regulator [Alphaproteobacteria bacterium]MBU1402479.1 LysR family transcriptional regulator [Alphaproteobacteria bacterium]MBU1593120.1 LysR family transcriptional regulator [Alphaproteobacteria bacterium]